MARKRDYKAEYARRQALAKSRGYESYSAYRRGYETGQNPAVNYKRIKKEKTKRAQVKWFEGNTGDLFDFEALVEMLTPKLPKQDECEIWSAAYARTSVAEYNPDEAEELGLSKREYTEAYWDCFVGGPDMYSKNRKSGSPAMRRWFVEITQYFEAEDYDDRYSIA